MKKLLFLLVMIVSFTSCDDKDKVLDTTFAELIVGEYDVILLTFDDLLGYPQQATKVYTKASVSYDDRNLIIAVQDLKTYYVGLEYIKKNIYEGVIYVDNSRANADIRIDGYFKYYDSGYRFGISIEDGSPLHRTISTDTY